MKWVDRLCLFLLQKRSRGSTMRATTIPHIDDVSHQLRRYIYNCNANVTGKMSWSCCNKNMFWLSWVVKSDIHASIQCLLISYNAKVTQWVYYEVDILKRGMVMIKQYYIIIECKTFIEICDLNTIIIIRHDTTFKWSIFYQNGKHCKFG